MDHVAQTVDDIDLALDPALGREPVIRRDPQLFEQFVEGSVGLGFLVGHAGGVGHGGSFEVPAPGAEPVHR